MKLDMVDILSRFSHCQIACIGVCMSPWYSIQFATGAKAITTGCMMHVNYIPSSSANKKLAINLLAAAVSHYPPYGWNQARKSLTLSILWCS